MNRYFVGAVLLCLMLTAPAFSQSNSSLSGTVADATGGVLPGVAVTATNSATAVATPTVTNAAGVYNFASLPPGTYKVTAELAGFQTQTFTDVALRAATQVRLNFTLQVRKLEQQVEVSISTERLLLESSSSVGLALPEKTVNELPLVNNNVLDLIKVMGGTVLTDQNPIFAADTTVMAGVSAGNINLQRDGVTVNDVRYSTGLNSPLRLNNEMVGEFKVLLSPVDAEVGRGAGQVQILSKSGGNAYHGSAVWSIQNSALDSNEYHYNRTGTQPNWRNMNEYTASVGGPIIKNKTFFFVMWNQQISRQRQTVNPIVLTPCARKGIFRWYDNWMSTNILGSESTTGITPTRRAVDAAGNPIAPTTNPDGTPFTGRLHAGYVFGQLLKEPTANDCSDFNPTTDVIAGTPYDSFRTGLDSTGYVSRFTGIMPVTNNYEVGDGLNTGGHKWTLGLKGGDNILGLGEDNLRKQLNVKIDHNFNDRHRISGSFSYEKSTADDSFPSWPNGYGGSIERKPKYVSVQLTSTLKPTLLNEFRFGMSRTDSMTYDAIYNPMTGSDMVALLQDLYDTNTYLADTAYKGLPLHINPGSGNMGFHTDVFSTFAFFSGTPQSNPVGSRGNLPVPFGGYDPRWTYSDTLTWTNGRHSFKWGGELRMAKSYQDRQGTGRFFNDANVYTSVIGGSTANSQIYGINGFAPGLTGLIGFAPYFGSANSMANLLNYFSGSVANLRDYVYVNSPTALTWSDFTKGEQNQIFDIRMKEWDFFFKDDWKVTDDLTLNLGIRYEYYGVPYVESGMAVGLEGGPSSIFGISGGGFDNWLSGNIDSTGSLTKQTFVGPNSPNPSQQVYKDDWNNIGPAVGFAWQLPWGGKGKTTLRGGYQISYLPISRADGFAGVIANTIGTSYTNVYSGDSSTPYMNFAMLPDLLPTQIPSDAVPLQTIPITQRTQTYTVYDENLRNPYVQNLTMALVRNIGSNLTVDVRYIGTLTRKSTGTVALNSSNFINNGLMDAFNAARRGGESPLLDQIFNGINYAGNGYGPVGTVYNGVPQTGAMHLRASGNTNSNLANGNFSALAGTLATANYVTTNYGNGSLPYVPSGVNGSILRYNGFPENFIYTNPQFATANMIGNLAYNNYHGMQANVTLRPTHGFSLVGTYTWSRNLGLLASGYTDPLDRASDYALVNGHRAHQLVTYGTFDLPFGQGRTLFKDVNRAVDAFIGGWQMTWIFNYASGSPNSITASTTSLYSNAIPDFVGPEGSFDNKMGHVTWEPGADKGNYFDNKYVKIKDPQCASVTAAQGLQNVCTMQALALADDQSVIVFQNAAPGTRGNFGRMNVTNLGRWTLDAAMGKSFRVREGMSFTVRVDATNIFNHPMPSLGYTTVSSRTAIAANPDMTLAGTNDFGLLDNKVGTRTFQAKLRFDF